jgi:RND superfamily putative drug exporter
MFQRIGRAVSHHPIWTIVVWVIAVAAIIATAPALPSNSDQSSFLPKDYESIEAATVQKEAFPQAFTPAAIVLYERADGKDLTAADSANIKKITAELGKKKIDEVQKVVPGVPSKDGKYDMALVQMREQSTGLPEQADAAKELRKDSKELAAEDGLKAKVGGGAAQNLDQQDSAKKGDQLIFFGTFLIILVALLIIFRSPLIAILPLVLIGVVAGAANGLIAFATKLFDLEANSSVSAILIVVLFGVGTDYVLFLLFRYRERLRLGEDRKEAMTNAVGRVGEAIAASAGVVMIAFLALTFSSVGFLRQMGPALAIAVAVTLLAGLTLIPAVFSLIRPRVLFWPSSKWKKEPSNARFAALGGLVKRRPGLVAAVSGVLMAALALGTLGFKANFDLAAGSMPKTEESMVVQADLERSYTAGAAEPTDVFLSSTGGKPLDKAELPAYQKQLDGVDGVDQVAPPKLSKDGKTADFTVLLSTSGASEKSLETIDKVKDTAHAKAPSGTEAKVGGLTAVYKDIDTATKRDYRVVFPIAALAIMLILGLQLRSVVAPWYLMASVGLGFGATLGASVLIFQNMMGHSGLMFMLPVIMYMFVVAIGTDYNILMIARLREEAREGRSPREAASMALRHAGPTVAAAGFILAATFATMILAGNSFLSEMGFAVAFGILIAAFVMAMFFTPALTALIGHAAWWPGHGDRASGSKAEAPSVALGKEETPDQGSYSERQGDR